MATIVLTGCSSGGKAPTGVLARTSSPGLGTAIAIDTTHVYWAIAESGGRGGVYRVSKNGGAVETIAATTAGSVAVDDRFVYWGEGDPNAQTTLRRRAKLGGETVTLGSSASRTGIASDGAYVYWGSGCGETDSGTIRRVPIDGGPSQDLASGQCTWQLALADDGSLYWLVGWLAKAPGAGHVSMVRRMERGGGPIVDLLVVDRQIEAFAISRGKIAWVTSDSAYELWQSQCEAPGACTSVQLDGGVPGTWGNFGVGDGTAWYWTSDSALRSGNLMFVPQDGAKARSLGALLGGVLAVDDERVYGLTTWTGEVFAFAKRP